MLLCRRMRLKLPIQSVLSLSLPMVGSRFLQMLSGFAGQMMAAQLGKTVLAASALINSTFVFILLIFLPLIFSLSFLCAELFGAKKYSDIGELVQQGVVLSLLLSLVMMICLWFSPLLLSAFHENPVLIHYVRDYFRLLTWGVAPILLQNCLEQFCFGVGRQRIVMWVNAFSLLVGVGFAYVFIFGKCGFSSLGIRGLALGFALQATINFLILLTIIFFSKSFQIFSLFQFRRHYNWRWIKKIMQVGWPMSVQFGGELAAFFVMTMMIGWLGVRALAAVQITQQWLLLLIVPVFAMSEAAGILVGQAIGANNRYQLRGIGQASLMVAVCFVALVSIAYLLFPDFLASFYIAIHDPRNAPMLHLVRILFILTSVTLLLASIRDVISGLLRGLLDTRFPMMVGLAVMWGLVIPLGYWMAIPLHDGVVGFRVGANIALAIGAVIVCWRWRFILTLIKHDQNEAIPLSDAQ